MLKRVWMAFVAAAVLVGCAQNPSTPSGQTKSALPSRQTVALKQPAHAVLLRGQKFSDEIFRITAVTGKPWYQVSSSDGELWLVLVQTTGLLSSETIALRWDEISQIKRASVDGNYVYYVSSRKDRASGTSMTLYRAAALYVCEPGANPKASEAGCLKPEKFTASRFYASDDYKPTDATESFDMSKLLTSLGSFEATNVLAAEEYSARRAKWTAANEKYQAQIAAEKAQIVAQAERAERLAREFLTKAKKGASDSCRSVALLANGEPAGSGTSFECGGSRYVSLGELQRHGWAVTSMMRERMTNAIGVAGYVVMITVEKTR